MSQVKAKTTENTGNVLDFIKAVPDEQKQKDAMRLIQIMKEASGFEPKMWGPSIIGFGSYHYTYESGHEGNAPLVGFSPRKGEISLYLTCEAESREKLLKEFGKHKSGKSCIYIKKVDDINTDVLKLMIQQSINFLKARYKKVTG